MFINCLIFVETDQISDVAEKEGGKEARWVDVDGVSTEVLLLASWNWTVILTVIASVGRGVCRGRAIKKKGACSVV